MTTERGLYFALYMNGRSLCGRCEDHASQRVAGKCVFIFAKRLITRRKYVFSILPPKMATLKPDACRPMRFRPCVDLHDGKVKQIVGASLVDGAECEENFVSEKGSDYFAQLYK